LNFANVTRRLKWIVLQCTPGNVSDGGVVSAGFRIHLPAYHPGYRVYRVPMDPLYRRAIIQGILGTILFIALIFWPAGTFHYWQGWLFLAVFSASTIGFTIYLALYNKPLLDGGSRLGRSTRKSGRKR
jgi:hypothetical protein